MGDNLNSMNLSRRSVLAGAAAALLAVSAGVAIADIGNLGLTALRRMSRSGSPAAACPRRG